MTENKAKNLLIDYFLSIRKFPCTSTEIFLYGNYRADIIALDNKLRLLEVEIKVTKDDLISEINSIKYSLGKSLKKNLPLSGYCNKYTKHDSYLKFDSYSKKNRMDMVPTKFYFAVPEYLLDIAEEGLKDTPYGLILLVDNVGAVQEPKVVKGAKSIHNEPIPVKDYKHYLIRISRENFRLREKKDNLEKIINQYKNDKL